MLPRFFTSAVAIANHAESGKSIRSSLGARRFNKFSSLIRPWDPLFSQFGRNDSKETETDALQSYRQNLSNFVEQTLALGAQSVLVTLVERKPGPQYRSHDAYPQTVRDVAARWNVPLIDLHSMSQQLYAARGEDLDRALQDGTHHTSYGSYLLAQCVVEGIRASGLQLATAPRADLADFAPDRPLPFSQFAVPPSPRHDPRLAAGK